MVIAVGVIATVFMVSVSAIFPKFASGGALRPLFRSLLRITMMREFFNVVHDAVELPLGVDLGLASEREAIKSLVVAQVAKHRLHRGDAPALECPAFC